MPDDTTFSQDEFTPIGDAAPDGIHFIEMIAEGAWRIDEHCFVNCYLLVGTERVLLIDTGMGFGDVREAVRTLTDLLLDVAATHRHCDHMGGAGWFETCHVHRSDLRFIYALTGSRLASKVLLAMRAWMLSKMKRDGVDVPASITDGLPAFSAPAHGAHLVAIDDGYIFHLGDRDVSVINVPGHTCGSIVLLDDREKLMFAGDDANPAIWMQLPACTSLVTWAPGCERILELAETYTPYGGHGRGSAQTRADCGSARPGKQWIDVMQRGVSKATGLLQVMDVHGAHADEVMAFGDSMNDYEILRMVGEGVAMGNARSAIKMIARRTIETNVEQSVQKELRRLAENGD